MNRFWIYIVFVFINVGFAVFDKIVAGMGFFFWIQIAFALYMFVCAYGAYKISKRVKAEDE